LDNMKNFKINIIYLAWFSGIIYQQLNKNPVLIQSIVA